MGGARWQEVVEARTAGVRRGRWEVLEVGAAIRKLLVERCRVDAGWSCSRSVRLELEDDGLLQTQGRAGGGGVGFRRGGEHWSG
jgi:hypothetical protein